jgi:hypothetical protein
VPDAPPGVQKGAFANWILGAVSRWDGREYVMVDPWTHQADYVDGANQPNDEQEKRYTEARAVAAKYADRIDVRIVRDFSLNASRRFDDGYFDVVYIDARHDYDSAMDDMLAWWPKCKVGCVCGRWQCLG